MRVEIIFETKEVVFCICTVVIDLYYMLNDKVCIIDIILLNRDVYRWVRVHSEKCV